MKKLFVLMMAAVLGSASLMAQEVEISMAQEEQVSKSTEYDWSARRNTLSISGGACSFYYPLRLVLFGWIQPAVDHAQNSRYYGEYGINYHYQVAKWCRVGFKAAWEGDGYEMFDKKKEDGGVRVGDVIDHSAILMASAQFTYLNKKHVKLYSGLDLGADAYMVQRTYDAGHTDSDGRSHSLSCTWLPAVNITAIGVSGGSEIVFGFAEVNLGCDAIFKAGVGFHL